MSMDNEQVRNDKDNLTLGLSLFIALCVIVLFCAISVAIAKNINGASHTHGTNNFFLPSLEGNDSTKDVTL